jgi:hypothetical protein
VLVPTLTHGDIAIMDNLGSRKVDEVRQAIETPGSGIPLIDVPSRRDVTPEQNWAPGQRWAEAPLLRPPWRVCR